MGEYLLEDERTLGKPDHLGRLMLDTGHVPSLLTDFFFYVFVFFLGYKTA